MAFNLVNALSGILQGAQQAGQQIDAGQRELFDRDQAAARRAEDLGFKERQMAVAERRLGMEEEKFTIGKKKAEIELANLKSTQASKQLENQLQVAKIKSELDFITDEETKKLLTETRTAKLKLENKESKEALMTPIRASFSKTGLDKKLSGNALTMLEEVLLIDQYAGVGSSGATKQGAASAFKVDPSKLATTIKSLNESYQSMQADMITFKDLKKDEERAAIETQMENIVATMESMTAQLARGTLTDQTLTLAGNRAQAIIKRDLAFKKMNASIPDRLTEGLYEDIAATLESGGTAKALGKALDEQQKEPEPVAPQSETEQTPINLGGTRAPQASEELFALNDRIGQSLADLGISDDILGSNVSKVRDEISKRLGDSGTQIDNATITLVIEDLKKEGKLGGVRKRGRHR